MPKVSAIIPVYNTEKYLEKCLDSVCNQTLSDIEIICIDDCSTDGSLEILKDYAQKDNRIKLIEFKENKGAAVARNTGIKTATGEYIGFIDSDDFIDLDFYEKLYNKAIETGADCSKGTMRCKDQDKEIAYDRNDLIKKNVAYFYDSFTTAIYKTNIIKNNNIFFPNNTSFFEDPYFSILLVLKINKIAIVDNANYHYINRTDSLVYSANENNILSGIKAMVDMANILNKENIGKEHYIIVYTYTISQIIAILYNAKYGKVLYDRSIISLYKVMLDCKYKKECLNQYFKMKREMSKRILLRKIRAKLNRR